MKPAENTIDASKNETSCPGSPTFSSSSIANANTSRYKIGIFGAVDSRIVPPSQFADTVEVRFKFPSRGYSVIRERPNHRELYMLEFIKRITDIPFWYYAVFDERYSTWQTERLQDTTVKSDLNNFVFNPAVFDYVSYNMLSDSFGNSLPSCAAD